MYDPVVVGREEVVLVLVLVSDVEVVEAVVGDEVDVVETVVETDVEPEHAVGLDPPTVDEDSAALSHEVIHPS